MRNWFDLTVVDIRNRHVHTLWQRTASPNRCHEIGQNWCNDIKLQPSEYVARLSLIILDCCNLRFFRPGEKKIHFYTKVYGKLCMQMENFDCGRDRTWLLKGKTWASETFGLNVCCSDLLRLLSLVLPPPTTEACLQTIRLLPVS